MVARGHDAAEIFLHEVGVLAHGLRERAEDDADRRELLLERRRDRHAVDDGVHRAAREDLYFFTRSGCSRTASENEQKMMPTDASFSLNVVATDTLSMTASTATPARISRSFRGTPSFSYMARSSGSTSARLFGAPSLLDLGAA